MNPDKSTTLLIPWQVRKRFALMDAGDAKRLKALVSENARLKKLVAERDLEIEVMKEINGKKW